MSTEERQVTEKPATEKPEVTEEHHDRAKKMMDAYDDKRPTVTMPGTDGAVAGTAVNEWIDDEGKPKYGEVEPNRD